MATTTFHPNDATTVTRALRLSEAADPAQTARLAAVQGIIAVVPSPDGKRLTVTYDVRGMVMGALVKVAASLGLKPSAGLIDRAGRAWAGFQDDNLRSQAKLEHHCCNAPPKG